MPMCKSCCQKLQASSSAPLCAECRLGAWPRVRALLTARVAERLYLDCTLQRDLQNWADQARRVAAAWQGYLTACSSVRRLPEAQAATSVEHQQAAQRAWEAERLGGQRYTALVAGVEPLIEAQQFFYVAVHMRREYRQYLRHRFRFEPRGGIWLPDKRPPQTGHEAACFTQTLLFYDFFTRIFLAGIDAVAPVQREDPALFLRAADAMRTVLAEGLSQVLVRDLHSPYEFQREGAAMSMAGYINPFFRLYPSLWQVLHEYGSNPRTVLQELLPVYIRRAYDDEARPPQELATATQRMIGQLRQKRHPPRNRRARGLVAVHQESKHPAPSELVEWHAKQELLHRLNESISRAGLSPREAEVLSLRQADLSYAAIASQLGISKSAAKTYTTRGLRKLGDTAHS